MTRPAGLMPGVVLGRVGLFMFGCAVILAAVAPIFVMLTGKWQEFCVGLTGALGAFLLTVVALRWEKLRMEDVGAAVNRSSPVRFVMGFILGLFVVGLWATALSIYGNLRWRSEPDTHWSGPALAFVAYVALSCREELAFHGYPLRRLNQLFGVWPAQLLVALVFALEHRLGGSSWLQAFAGSGTGSLLFGMASIATRGLAVPIGMHAAWNFGQWMLGMKGSPGFWKATVPEGQTQSTEMAGMLIYVVALSMATVVFWLWHRRQRPS